jgi:hypothetical protein
MTRYFAISTGTATIQVKENRTGSVTFTVTSNADEGIRTRAKITALSGEESWFSIEGEKEREYTEKTQQYTVNYTIPATAAPGSYTFRMDVFAIENPDEIYSEGPTVQIDVAKEQPPAPSKPSKFPWWIVAVVVAVVVAAAGIVYVVTKDRTTKVPKVTEKKIGDAESDLKALKFNVVSNGQLTVTASEVDIVTVQDPAPETEVKTGSNVTLTYGIEGTKVPPVFGLTIENALKKITEAGLTCRIATTAEVKTKIDEQKKAVESAPSPAPAPAPAPSTVSGTSPAQPNTLFLPVMRFYPLFVTPKVTSSDPVSGTVVEKNTTVTIYTGNSTKANAEMLKISDLKTIGIKMEMLKNYSN